MHKPGFQEQCCYQMLMRENLCRAERQKHSPVNEKTSLYLHWGFKHLISNFKIYVCIYSVTPSGENLKSILLAKNHCSHINHAIYFHLFFITTVCDHGNENPSYHHKLGESLSEATNLKGMSHSFSPQVTFWSAYLVFSPSYGQNCLQRKQANQESQTGRESCLPWKTKRISRPK